MEQPSGYLCERFLDCIGIWNALTAECFKLRKYKKKKDIINMTKHAYHQTRQIEQNYSPLEIKQ